MEKAKIANAHSAAGRSLLEMLWEELDAVTDRIVAEGRPGEPDQQELSEEMVIIDKSDLDRWVDDVQAWGETRGQAQGLAYAIAVITDPYTVNVPAVKRVAKRRWEERNAEE